MATKGTKSGVTHRSVHAGVNIKVPAERAAATMAEVNEMQSRARATAAQAMLEVGKACARVRTVEAINDAAYWYGEVRTKQGIKEGTINKEKSQLRQIARACCGGVKNQKTLDQNASLYPTELAALAKKITTKEFKTNRKGGGTRTKESVTDNEFKKMREWARLMDHKQRGIIMAILQRTAAADKVTGINEAKAKRKAA